MFNSQLEKEIKERTDDHLNFLRDRCPGVTYIDITMSGSGYATVNLSENDVSHSMMWKRGDENAKAEHR